MRQPEAGGHGQAGYTASVLARVGVVGGQGVDLGDKQVHGAGGGIGDQVSDLDHQRRAMDFRELERHTHRRVDDCRPEHLRPNARR